jgi:hypothetical protein
MKRKGNMTLFSKSLVLILFSGVFSFSALNAQIDSSVDPPRPVEVTVVENLSFGAFYQGAAGGTVTIDPSGVRTAGGDVILLGMSFVFNAAHYTIVGNEGTAINLSYNPSVTLAGPGTMTLTIDSTFPLSPFPLLNNKPLLNHLHIGGTLTVGPPASNPPGAYSGTFEIIFNQE